MPRKRSTREIPPRLELECLKALWSEGEADGTRVREYLADRELAYTTVVTLLERLVERGAASRRKSGRRFIYTPTVDRDIMRAAAVQELLVDFFGGSEESLRLYLAGGWQKSAGSAHEAASSGSTTAKSGNSRLDASLL